MKFPKIEWPKRAPVEPDPPGVTVKKWQVDSAFAASWAAFFIAAFFLGAYCLEVAGDRAAALHVTHAGTWIGELIFYVPLIIGFLMLSLGIPYLAKNVITWFVALSWRDAFWPKLWTLVLTVGVSSAIILGSFSTMGGAIVERGRESAVAVEQVVQQAAVLEARIADVRDAMNERTRSESVYVRTAASMSPEAYDRFVESRRDDWQYDRLRSYRSVSEEMVSLKGEMSALREQQAQHTVTAAVTATPETAETGWVISLLGWVRGAWALVLAVINDLACLFMGLIALALQLKRERQLGDAIPREFDASHAIADLREEASIVSEPMEPAKKKYYDENGEELVAFKGGYRRKGKRRTEANVNAEGIEAGVTDPKRTGSTAELVAGMNDMGASVATAATPNNPESQEGRDDPHRNDGGPEGDSVEAFHEVNHVETPSPEPTTVVEYTPEELDEIFGEKTEWEGVPAEILEDTPLGEDGSDGVMLADQTEEEVYDHPPAPESRRLVAAE
jgi:hypothetical protein